MPTADEVGVQNGVQLAPGGFKHVSSMQGLSKVPCLYTHADQHVVRPCICVLPWQHLCHNQRSVSLGVATKGLAHCNMQILLEAQQWLHKAHLHKAHCQFSGLPLLRPTSLVGRLPQEVLMPEPAQSHSASTQDRIGNDELPSSQRETRWTGAVSVWCLYLTSHCYHFDC